jgi:hypothetical protein
LTSALVGREWSASHPGHIIPGESLRYPLDRRLGEPQSGSRRRGEGKNLASAIINFNFGGVLTRIYNLSLYSTILVKLMMDQLAKKIPIRYATRRSITVFTIAHKRTCSERDLPFVEKHCSAAGGSTVRRNQTNTVLEEEASVISSASSLLPMRQQLLNTYDSSQVAEVCFLAVRGKCWNSAFTISVLS